MGTSYEFVCTLCGYSKVVSGGNDVGMLSAATTIICKDCKELYDIVVSEEPWLAMSNSWNPDADKISCPVSKVHECCLWVYPGSCPRCGGKMKYGSQIIMWD